MYQISLGVYDVVLVSQCLNILGLILWDFAELCMKFMIDDHKYTLKGVHSGSS